MRMSSLGGHIELSCVDTTLNAWSLITYRLRKLVLRLHHIPLPNNFFTEFETVEDICRTLQRSLGYLGYVPGYLHFRTGRDSWFHACLLVAFLDVPDSDIEAWEEAALLLLLFISGSIAGNHPGAPDLFPELNYLLHTTELGRPGTLGYDIHPRMLKEEEYFSKKA